MTMHSKFASDAGDGAAVHSGDIVRGKSIPTGTGFVNSDWTCLVTANPTGITDKYNVQVRLTEKTRGRMHETNIVLMTAGDPGLYRFELPDILIPDAHLMATLQRTSPTELNFCVSSFSIDPASLLGVRNIAINDIIESTLS